MKARTQEEYNINKYSNVLNIRIRPQSMLWTYISKFIFGDAVVCFMLPWWCGSGADGVCSSHQWWEHRVWPIPQHIWRVKLYCLSDTTHSVRIASGLGQHVFCVYVCYLSIAHDQNAICVQHSVDPVGDGEHGAVLESLFDGALDQSVCLWVNGCCCLIQQNDLLDKRDTGVDKSSVWKSGELDTVQTNAAVWVGVQCEWIGAHGPELCHLNACKQPGLSRPSCEKLEMHLLMERSLREADKAGVMWAKMCVSSVVGLHLAHTRHLVVVIPHNNYCLPYMRAL